MEQTNDLVVVINQSGLDTSKSESLMKSFAGYFTEAKEIAEKSKSIIVTDESQVDEMKKAREYRLKLKEIRVSADKTRAELKEQSLREGNAIQGVYNIIKALVVPVEEYLEKQEKFAEVKEQLRLEKQYNERVEKLSKYVTDVSLYSLKDMPDEVFENLLSGCKANFEKAQEEQRLAEEKQKQEAEREKRDQDRKIKSASLMDYIDIPLDELLNMSDEKFKEVLEKANNNKKRYEAEQEKIRKQNEELQKKADEERKAKEEAERKLREEREAQAKKEADEKAQIEADKRAKEEADRQKLLAPDKEKILDFAIQLSKIEAPAVKSNEANQILSEALKIIITAVDTLQNGAKKL